MDTRKKVFPACLGITMSPHRQCLLRSEGPGSTNGKSDSNDIVDDGAVFRTEYGHTRLSPEGTVDNNKKEVASAVNATIQGHGETPSKVNSPTPRRRLVDYTKCRGDPIMGSQVRRHNSRKSLSPSRSSSLSTLKRSSLRSSTSSASSATFPLYSSLQSLSPTCTGRQTKELDSAFETTTTTTRTASDLSAQKRQWMSRMQQSEPHLPDDSGNTMSRNSRSRSDMNAKKTYDEHDRIDFFLKVPVRRSESNSSNGSTNLYGTSDREKSTIACLREGLNKKRSYFRKPRALSTDESDLDRSSGGTRPDKNKCANLMNEERRMLESVLADMKANITATSTASSSSSSALPSTADGWSSVERRRERGLEPERTLSRSTRRTRRSSIIQRSIRSKSLDH